jgi:hypothetical protein
VLEEDSRSVVSRDPIRRRRRGTRPASAAQRKAPERTGRRARSHRPGSCSGFAAFGGAEASEGSVDEEDLDRDVRLDVYPAHEREDVAARELLDHVLKAASHDALEVLADRDHTLGFAAVHDGLLERSETAASQNDDDHVVSRVRLGFARAAPIMIVQHPDDAG